MADEEGTPGGHKPHERGTVNVNCHYEQANHGGNRFCVGLQFVVGNEFSS